MQVKIFLTSRACQLNYGTSNGTDTEEEIRFKNRRRTFKTAERKGKNAVKTLKEFCKFEGERKDFEHFNAGAFANCSLTFNFIYHL